MRNIYFIIIFIFFYACGGDATGSGKKMPTPTPTTNAINMEVNQKYEVYPDDIYIPIDKNTKLKIEYQPLIDKKFIMILNGEAILERKI